MEQEVSFSLLWDWMMAWKRVSRGGCNGRRHRVAVFWIEKVG